LLNRQIKYQSPGKIADVNEISTVLPAKFRKEKNAKRIEDKTTVRVRVHCSPLSP
jgi:hypothetical protein